MTQEPAIWKSVRRHFVTLSGMVREKDGERERPFVCSGFLLELDGTWFLVTAGHVITEIQRAVSKGHEFDRWRLGDDTRGKDFANSGIPIDFQLDDWLFVDLDSGADYAALPIEGLYRSNLAAGNARPIPSESCGSVDTPGDRWCVVGIPAETVDHDGESVISARQVIALLDPCGAPPQARKTHARFYARLHDDANIKDVSGMSGGPVFVIKKDDGKLGYGLIAVQSAWFRDERIIAACPIVELVRALRAVLAEHARKNAHERPI